MVLCNKNDLQVEDVMMIHSVAPHAKMPVLSYCYDVVILVSDSPVK